MTDAPDSRLVARYIGCQIFDVREHIEIVFTRQPVRGVGSALKYAHGFERLSSNVYRARSNPNNIFAAHAVLAEFGYSEERP